MRATKKFFAIILMAALFISASSTQAFAAGVETWYGGWVTEDTITVTDTNLTPVKTIGVSGTLHLSCGFSGLKSYPDSPPVKVTMQIRDLNGNVLASDTRREDDFMPQVHLEIPVTRGQRIQVFFDVSSVSYNYHGDLRRAEITYSHEIY